MTDNEALDVVSCGQSGSIPDALLTIYVNFGEIGNLGGSYLEAGSRAIVLGK